MKKLFGLKICLLVSFTLGATLSSLTAQAAPEKVDWSKFAEYEPWKSPTIPSGLAKLNKKEIKIPGFMLPLETEANKVTQFLFVPSLPACQHVPPPPPNLTVMVKMQKGKKTAAFDDPIWVTGTLKVLEKIKVQEGDALYEIEATNVELYK